MSTVSTVCEQAITKVQIDDLFVIACLQKLLFSVLMKKYSHIDKGYRVCKKNGSGAKFCSDKNKYFVPESFFLFYSGMNDDIF